MDYSALAPELLVTKDGPVRILTMNRPDDLNTFNGALHRAVRDVWTMLIDDDEADAVVLTGAGRAFSAGGYMPDFIRNQADTKARRRDIREAERLAMNMLSCELPVVAAVNGLAIGLGCSLAVMADLVVMSEEAFISDPHVSVGLVAGDGGAVTWPLMIGMLRAKEYILLGDRITAEEALRLGLANRVTPKDDVVSTAVELAHRLAAQPRQALRDTKRAMNAYLKQAANMIMPFALAAESESFGTEEVARAAEQLLSRSKRKEAEQGGSAG
jgi:enoyl-CoA hydratase